MPLCLTCRKFNLHSFARSPPPHLRGYKCSDIEKQARQGCELCQFLFYNLAKQIRGKEPVNNSYFSWVNWLTREREDPWLHMIINFDKNATRQSDMPLRCSRLVVTVAERFWRRVGMDGRMDAAEYCIIAEEGNLVSSDSDHGSMNCNR